MLQIPKTQYSENLFVQFELSEPEVSKHCGDI